MLHVGTVMYVSDYTWTDDDGSDGDSGVALSIPISTTRTKAFFRNVSYLGLSR